MSGMRTILGVIGVFFLLGVGGLALSLSKGWFLTDVRPTRSNTTSAGVAQSPAAPGFETSTDETPIALSQKSTASLHEAPAGYTESRSELYRFALFYPSDLVVKAYDEGGGASTFTFQNTLTSQGFQIFVVPYAGAQVSEAQFRKDEPSGVMQEPTNVTVDGVFGTMFFGSVPPLGDTREVWFINNGYLFEVSAPKSQDSWLQGIIGSFRFI